MSTEIHYFQTPAAMRGWLRKQHASASELHVGFRRRHTAEPGITWAESVAEALCFGWIDGVRRKIDGDRYRIRFTPRKPGSIWSDTNIRLATKLVAADRMTAAGSAAFAARSEARSRKYSYEQPAVQLDANRLRTFKRDAVAWEFFANQAPSYQKKVLWWVMSAKQDDARDRRFARILAASKARKRLE
jgi:uncharacterized protein YdeI (YjbR/CyaY-like superfamily)